MSNEKTPLPTYDQEVRELDFQFDRAADDVSPIKTISYPGTENFIVDPKLEMMDHDYSNLIQPHPKSLHPISAPMARQSSRSIVLLKGTQLLLSPGNPAQKLIFFTEP